MQRERPDASYRDVMASVLDELATEAGTSLPADERDALGGSLPGWPIFPEVPAALAEARDRGWSLAALTNSDRDLIDASLEVIGVPFDGTVVASEIGSYKPAHRHWHVFDESTGADPELHVHVAQSHFHDIAPASELGIRSVWINRLAERRDPAPTRELRDLNGLADVLDELVPRALSGAVRRRRPAAQDDLRLGVGSAEAHSQRAQEHVELGGVAAGHAQLVVGRPREVEDLGDRLEAVGGGGEVVGVGAGGERDADHRLEAPPARRGVHEGGEAGDHPCPPKPAHAVRRGVGAEADLGAQVAPGEPPVFAE